MRHIAFDFIDFSVILYYFANKEQKKRGARPCSKKYILVLTIILAVLMMFCGCTQIKNAELEPGTTFYNTENIYTNGLFNPTPLYTKWVIEENGITIKTEYEEKTMGPISRGWQELPFSNEGWNAFLIFRKRP